MSIPITMKMADKNSTAHPVQYRIAVAVKGPGISLAPNICKLIN